MRVTWKNTSSHFGRVARYIHWVSAFWVIGLISVGLYMTRIPPSPFRFLVLYTYHKFFGFLFLGLVLIRLFWRLWNRAPELPSMPAIHRFLAKLSVPVLYFMMLLMPLSGFIMSHAGGHAIEIPGYGSLPLMLPQNPVVAGTAHTIHIYASYLFIAIISAHFLAALYHHFILRNSILRRMLSQRR